MKICYVTSGSENVGTYFRAFFWAKYLVKRNHEVTLISSHEKPNWDLFNYKNRDGVNILTYIKSPFKFDYIGYLFRPILVFIHIMFNDYDIVHSFVSWQPPSLAALLAIRIKRILGSKTRLYADWDDLWGGIGGIACEHGFILLKIITFLEIKIPNLADKISICSQFLYDKALQSGIDKNKLFIIYNGSNIDDINPLPKQLSRKQLKINLNEEIVLLIGQFQTMIFPKLIRALQKVFENDQNFRLYILGNLSSDYQKLINKYSRNIIFKGKVDYKLLPIYFSAADLLLLPMDDTDVERARFPIRFGDYLASGTPILASPQGEVANIIKNNNVAFTANLLDIDNYVITLVKHLKNQSGMGKRARNYAENFLSWEIIAAKIEKLYE
jgi:glycosyltransferase involved in cell wall biosynthesis